MKKRFDLNEIISRHKSINPDTDYDYSETVMGKDIHDKIEIICKKHGKFKQSPHEHMKGQGCPFCAVELKKMKKTTPVEEIIEKSKNKFGEKFSYEITEQTYKNVKSVCMFHCNDCGCVFKDKPIYHLRKENPCPVCRKNESDSKKEMIEKEKMFRKENKEKLKEEKERLILEKKINKERIKQEKIKDRENRRGIYEYKHSKLYLSNEFKSKVKEKYGDKFDLSLVSEDNYVNSTTKIPIICHQMDSEGNEHGIFKIRPDQLMTRGVCPKCSKRQKLTPESLLRRFKEVHGNRYEYFELEGKTSYDTIDIFCKKHERIFKQVLVTHLQGSGCPLCCRSLNEEKIDALLYNKGIKHETQKRFEWLGKQSLDFYLPEINVGIEVQGIQHFIPIDAFGGEKAYKECLERDKRKLELCKENNVNLIYYLDKDFVLYLDNTIQYATNTNELLKLINNY